MAAPTLIGIGGTNAGGKDTLAEHLAETYGYLFISISDMIREVAMEREGNILRPTLHKIANALRAERGGGYFAEMAIDHFKQGNNHVGLVTSSIRTRGEIESIKKAGGIIVFIDADTKIRYDRIMQRNRADDAISYDEFVAQEQAEWHQSDDPAQFSMRSVKEVANFSFMNTGDIQAFYDEVATALELNT